MAKIHMSPKFFLPVLGLWAAACSSSDDRSQVLLNLQLGAGVSAPQTVHVIAMQNGLEVKTFDVSWRDTTGTGVDEVGPFFPSTISGPVTVSAKAYAQNQLVAQGQVAEPVLLAKGETVGPYALVLNASFPFGNDGGIDGGLPDTDTGLGDTSPSNPRLDGGAGDGSAADTLEVSDAPGSGQDAQDAPTLSDTGSDATLGSADGADAALAQSDGKPAGDAGMAWEPAANIQKDPAHACYGTVVAVDPANEHVYVAWNEASSIKVRRWNRQTAEWEKTVTLDDRGTPNSPAISADAKGNVMMLWGQDTRGNTPTTDGVWMSRTTDGTSWSPPARIASEPAYEVTFALARNGTGHAAYSKKKGNTWPLHTAYYDGTAWTENARPVEPEPYTADSEPQIALSALGDGIMIYSKSWGVAGTALTGTNFSEPIMLDPNYEKITAYDPTLAVNRKGEGVVIWTEYNGSSTVALARAYNPTTGWSAVTPPLVTASTVATPAVALDEQGMVTFVWQQDLVAGGANLMGKHGSLSGTWSEIAILEMDNRAGHSGLVTDYAYPRAAIDGNGDVLVVWRKDLTEGTTKTYGVYGTRYAGGTWLPQVKLGQKTGFDVPSVSLAVSDSGLGAAVFKYMNASATNTDLDSDNATVALFR